MLCIFVIISCEAILTRIQNNMFYKEIRNAVVVTRVHCNKFAITIRPSFLCWLVVVLLLFFVFVFVFLLFFFFFFFFFFVVFFFCNFIPFNANMFFSVVNNFTASRPLDH